jgi:hypothetical protein
LVSLGLRSGYFWFFLVWFRFFLIGSRKASFFRVSLGQEEPLFFLFRFVSPVSHLSFLFVETWIADVSKFIVENLLTDIIFLVVNVVQNSGFINLVTKSVLNEDGRHFVYSSTELWANGSCFIVYLARPEFTSHAIVLEIQTEVTKISMKRSIEKCLQLYNQFKVQPCLVILCIGTISLSESFLSPTSQNTCWKTMDCTAWAEKCLIISKDAIDLSDNEINQHLDPLVVLSVYFSNDEIQKQKLQDIGDSTIQLLHTID